MDLQLLRRILMDYGFREESPGRFVRTAHSGLSVRISILGDRVSSGDNAYISLEAAVANRHICSIISKARDIYEQDEHLVFGEYQGIIVHLPLSEDV